MKKIFLILFIGFYVFSFGFSFGQNKDLSNLLAQTLSVEDSNILPNSPFYFIKELSRNIQKTFTFNEVKRIKLELKFLDEKLLEAKKLFEKDPTRIDALKKALNNYKNQFSNLEKRLNLIKEKTNSEQLEKLIENILDRSIKQQLIIEGLINKMDERIKQEFESEINNLKQEAENLIFNSPRIVNNQKIPEFLEKVVEEQLVKQQNDSVLSTKLIEFIDNLNEKKFANNNPEQAKKIERLKENIILNFILPSFVDKKSVNLNTTNENAFLLKNKINEISFDLEKFKQTINDSKDLSPASKAKILETIVNVVEKKSDNFSLPLPIIKQEVLEKKYEAIDNIKNATSEFLTEPQTKVRLFLDKENKENLLKTINEVKNNVLDLNIKKGEDVKYIFVINPPQNSESNYQIGSAVDITWRSLNVKKVKVYFCGLNDNCVLANNIPENGINNNHHFRFVFDKNHPLIPLKNGRFKIVDADNLNVYGFSGYFSVSELEKPVVSKRIKIFDLNIKQLYFKDTLKLKWESYGVSRVKISICLLQLKSQKVIAEKCKLIDGPDDGFYNNNFFDIYIDPNKPYFSDEENVKIRIKVEDAYDSNIYDYTGIITIIGKQNLIMPNLKEDKINDRRGKIIILQPISEMKLVAGTYLDLKWSSDSATRFKIYICRLHPKFKKSIESEECKIVEGEEMINKTYYRLYFNPNHPYFPLELGRIKIVDADNETIFAYTPFIKVSYLDNKDVKEETMTTTYPNFNKPFEKKPDLITE